ncbi:MAG: hypothetical protein NTX88_00605, partial [Candidatus Atribacteria bacterium]|nr:hypothetical protein [Candidatus Atribacteria bacterium]
MKKIIIIFIFALCLLSAMEIICFAKEPYNHGKFWNSWSDNTRTIYISGFKDGFIELNGQFYYDLLLEETGVFDKYLKDLEVVKNEEKNIKEMNDFISLDNEVIINIMTDL